MTVPRSAPRFPPVDEQLERLMRGAVDVVTRDELTVRLGAARDAGRPLRVKVGFDPSAPDLHLGHAVLLRKMRQFQDLGHEVVLVIGDFTGLIGDPTGRSRTRPQLTPAEVQANAETYKAQAFRILDPERTRVRFNSEWLGTLGSEGFIRLAARYSVARMLERRDFRQRYAAGESIRIHEFLYPLAQAYDSVVLEADVELGGTDQLFNLNVGRDLMPEYGLPPQLILTTPLLVGVDGVEKMSKSYGNAIGMTEPPREIFGKIMSISDDLMWTYWELCTAAPPAEIEALKQAVAGGTAHPRQVKSDLARRIVGDLAGAEAALAVAAEFDRVFAQGAVPDAVTQLEVAVGGPYLRSAAPAKGTTVGSDLELLLVPLLADQGLAPSRSEARRLIAQHAVEVDGGDWSAEMLAVSTDRLRAGVLIKVGRRRFLRVVLAGASRR